MNQLATNANTQAAQRENLSQLLWLGFILLFFVIQAILWTVAIMFTSNDKSHAVVAGYDEQALNWDELVAERKASQQLGWTATLTVDPEGDILNVHNFTIQLSDRDGKAIDGANVTLQAFHRGLAGDPQAIELKESEDGTYSGEIRVQKSGHWQFEGRAVRDDSLFLIEDRQFLKASN